MKLLFMFRLWIFFNRPQTKCLNLTMFFPVSVTFICVAMAASIILHEFSQGVHFSSQSSPSRTMLWDQICWCVSQMQIIHFRCYLRIVVSHHLSSVVFLQILIFLSTSFFLFYAILVFNFSNYFEMTRVHIVLSTSTNHRENSNSYFPMYCYGANLNQSKQSIIGIFDIIKVFC